jgi:GAF domain-containing protein
MPVVQVHPADKDRLDALHSHGVLDTDPERTFDRVVALAAHVCATPMAAVTLVGSSRQWFKATVGLGWLTQTPRPWSCCSDVVAAAASLVVTHAHTNPRYRKNPLVSGRLSIRSYAGAPLIGRDGLSLGAVCVMDPKPRKFDGKSPELLAGLAEQVVMLLEARRRDHGAGLMNECVFAEARQHRDVLSKRRFVSSSDIPVALRQHLFSRKPGHGARTDPPRADLEGA